MKTDLRGRDVTTYMLTYNPDLFYWDPAEHKRAADETAHGTTFMFNWSTGGRKGGIEIGDPILFLRQGRQRGLIGSGHAASTVYQDVHWDGGRRTANYIDVDWQRILLTEDRLDIDTLIRKAPIAGWQYGFQASGNRLRPEAEPLVRRLWNVHLANTDPQSGTIAEPTRRVVPEVRAATPAPDAAAPPIRTGAQSTAKSKPEAELLPRAEARRHRLEWIALQLDITPHQLKQARQLRANAGVRVLADPEAEIERLLGLPGGTLAQLVTLEFEANRRFVGVWSPNRQPPKLSRKITRRAGASSFGRTLCKACGRLPDINGRCLC